jgi:hypothetical protein
LQDLLGTLQFGDVMRDDYGMGNGSPAVIVRIVTDVETASSGRGKLKPGFMMYLIACEAFIEIFLNLFLKPFLAPHFGNRPSDDFLSFLVLRFAV